MTFHLWRQIPNMGCGLFTQNLVPLPSVLSFAVKSR
jgi:hypothetical protein